MNTGHVFGTSCNLLQHMTLTHTHIHTDPTRKSDAITIWRDLDICYSVEHFSSNPIFQTFDHIF